MAKVKKKRKVEKGQDGWLENLLRFEIVVLLFALIGFYYFLSFSPIRMPKEPIVSPRVGLVPLPPASEPVLPVQEDGLQPTDDTVGLFGSSPEAAVQVITDLDPESQSDETTVVAAVPAAEAALTEAQSGDKMDDKSPVAVGAHKIVLTKDSKLQSVKPAIQDPAPPVESAVPRVIEVGSYVLQTDLQKFFTQLEDLGFVVKTETRKRPTLMSRVFMGPYSDRQEAQKMMIVVRKIGDQPFLYKQDAGYVVVIGSFYLEASVVAWKNRYQAAGLDPKVLQESLPMPHTLLLLDGPRVARDPEAVLAQVQAAGFTGAHLRTISSTSSK